MSMSAFPPPLITDIALPFAAALNSVKLHPLPGSHLKEGQNFKHPLKPFRPSL
jgi:hypothetical protein